MADINGTPGPDSLTGTGDDDFITGEAGNDMIDGAGGNDQLFGDEDDDTIHGGAGHDYLRAGSGDDSLYGDDGDDYLDGGIGNDRIDGGAGLDRIAFRDFGALGGITVDLRIQDGVTAQNTGQGMDVLSGIENVSGTRNSDTIHGDDGANWLWGGSDASGVTGNDSIFGHGGDDLIEVGTGDHHLEGGSGNDTLSLWGNDTDITAAGVTVSLALQDGTQVTEQGTMYLSGFENLSGSKYDDSLTGDAGDNVLAGDQGRDTLAGGDGDDILYGDGRIIVQTHGTGTSGPITIYPDVNVLDPLLVDGDDVLEGGLGDDQLFGGGGLDTASYASAPGGVQAFLDAGNGGSTGAAGEDSLFSIENLTGSAFNDQLSGDEFDNVLSGGDGHDALRGFEGNDTLLGGNGDDFLNGGLGDDVLSGGAGWDRAAYAFGATAGVTINLTIVGVAQNTGSLGMDTLTGIEHVSGTRFNDVLTGDGGDNWLWGGSNGAGVTGNDVISGGGGNDLIEVGAGTHTLSGGTGTDTWSLYGNATDITAAGVTVSLALQGAAQDTEQGMMNASGFENLSGSIHDDALTGDGGNNLLAGDRGNDVLSGGDGDDILYGDGRVMVDTHDTGGSGPIVTWGDVHAAFPADPAEVDGNDILNGGKGNDTLVGGGGDDLLTGGQGSDHFVFGPGSGHDRITDFAKKDVIVIQGVAGVDDFSDLTLTASGKDTLVSWGTGDTILIEGMKPKQLSASDFDFGAAPSAFAAAGVAGGDLSHGASAEHAAAHAAMWMP